MDYGVKAYRGWLGCSMSGCITAGPKSVARAMGAASLRRGTTANASQLPLPKVVKRYSAPVSSAISSTTPLPFFLPFRSSTGQAAVHPQRCRPTRVLSQALRTRHPASPRPLLVAGPGTDSIPSLRSGIPMSQWINTAISRWERSSDSWCGRSSPPPLIYHHDACCPVSAAINSWWPCLSCRYIAGMEQPSELLHPSPPFGNNRTHMFRLSFG